MDKQIRLNVARTIGVFVLSIMPHFNPTFVSETIKSDGTRSYTCASWSGCRPASGP